MQTLSGWHLVKIPTLDREGNLVYYSSPPHYLATLVMFSYVLFSTGLVVGSCELGRKLL